MSYIFSFYFLFLNGKISLMRTSYCVHLCTFCSVFGDTFSILESTERF
jgi:hypothetical protein